MKKMVEITNLDAEVIHAILKSQYATEIKRSKKFESYNNAEYAKLSKLEADSIKRIMESIEKQLIKNK